MATILAESCGGSYRGSWGRRLARGRFQPSISGRFFGVLEVSKASITDMASFARSIAIIVQIDLANPSGIRVVEREQLPKILSELQRENPTVDKATLAGRLLRADAVITGTVTAQFPDIKIDAQLVNARSGRVLRSFAAEGRPDSLLKTTGVLSREISRADFPSGVSSEAHRALADFLVDVGLHDVARRWRNLAGLEK